MGGSGEKTERNYEGEDVDQGKPLINVIMPGAANFKSSCTSSNLMIIS